jgi:hypothetical protein
MSNAGDLHQPDHEQFWFFSQPVKPSRDVLDGVRSGHYRIYNRAAYHAKTLEFLGYVRPEHTDDELIVAGAKRNVPLLLVALPAAFGPDLAEG